MFKLPTNFQCILGTPGQSDGYGNIVEQYGEITRRCETYYYPLCDCSNGKGYIEFWLSSNQLLTTYIIGCRSINEHHCNINLRLEIILLSVIEANSWTKEDFVKYITGYPDVASKAIVHILESYIWQ